MTRLNSPFETDIGFGSGKLKLGLANELDGVGRHLPAKWDLSLLAIVSVVHIRRCESCQNLITEYQIYIFATMIFEHASEQGIASYFRGLRFSYGAKRPLRRVRAGFCSGRDAKNSEISCESGCLSPRVSKAI
jgi:hypothetical protein